MSRNALTDVAGLTVGQAHDPRVASGVTAVLFDVPCVASVAIGGGAPGGRDVTLLEPGMTVERVDALVLSGGSAFGLDAAGGVQAFLRDQGRGFAVGPAIVPIVPCAILFDLANGGNKAWGQRPFYWDLGLQAARAASLDVELGSVGAGYGATTADYKGGLGSASIRSSAGFHVAALVAVNALGSAVVGEGPWFWAAPYERAGEFGGHGWPPAVGAKALEIKVKGLAATSTTIGIVATDAVLTKSQAKRMAVMAHDGLGKALRPTHAAMDGDMLFAASTARNTQTPTVRDLVEIGTLAADCVARACARGIYEARALPFAGSQTSWRDRFTGML